MGFQVERLYYTLNEVADRWNLQTDDLLHMAVQEKLRLSFWTEPRIISAYKKNKEGKNEKVVTFFQDMHSFRYIQDMHIIYLPTIEQKLTMLHQQIQK